MGYVVILAHSSILVNGIARKVYLIVPIDTCTALVKLSILKQTIFRKIEQLLAYFYLLFAAKIHIFYFIAKFPRSIFWK